MNIDEIENSTLTLKKIKFGSDECKLPNVEKPLQDSHFFYILNGKAGSGKTSLLTNMIMNKMMYKKKFDKIYIWSPSLCSMEDNIFTKLPKKQRFMSLEQGEIEEVLDDIRGTGDKVLFIFDDVVNELKNVDKLMKKIIMNRRHLTNSDDCDEKGFCSIILTTQAYNLVPLAIRKNASLIFTFSSTNEKEKRCIYEETMAGYKKEQFQQIWDYVFQDDLHNFLIILCNKNKLYKNFNELVINR